MANSLFVLFGLLLLLGCSAILRSDDTRSSWLVWLWIIGIGSQIVPAIRRLFDRTPQLTLTDTSVTDHTGWKRIIFWLDVKEATLRSNRTGTFICLEVDDVEKYLSQLSPLQRRRGMASVGTTTDLFGFLPVQRHLKKCSKAFALDLTGLKADANEVLAAVQLLIKQARENAPEAALSL